MIQRQTAFVGGLVSFREPLLFKKKIEQNKCVKRLKAFIWTKKSSFHYNFRGLLKFCVNLRLTITWVIQYVDRINSVSSLHWKFAFVNYDVRFFKENIIMVVFRKCHFLCSDTSSIMDSIHAIMKAIFTSLTLADGGKRWFEELVQAIVNVFRLDNGCFKLTTAKQWNGWLLTLTTVP